MATLCIFLNKILAPVDNKAFGLPNVATFFHIDSVCFLNVMTSLYNCERIPSLPSKVIITALFSVDRSSTAASLG